MGSTCTSQSLAAALLAGILALGSNHDCSADELIPADIAYKAPSASASATIAETPLIGTYDPQNPAAHTEPSNTNNTNNPSTSNPRPTAAATTAGCHNTAGLQKSLTITAFLRDNPTSANAGNLYAAELGFPQLIKKRLNERHQLLAPEVISLGTAATLSEPQLQRQAQHLAKAQRSQFVLTGRIRDMSMQNPASTYRPGLLQGSLNVVQDITRLHHFDRRARRFSAELALRDGFTGELLFTRSYTTSGAWTSRKPMGFDSPQLWKTPYGKRINQLANTISRDLAHAINCQPFMAPIDSRPGQTQVLLHGGANNGLHAGDNLKLYQLVVTASNYDYQMSDTRLIKRDIGLRLSEVYPSHSIAVLETGYLLNGQFLAVSD